MNIAAMDTHASMQHCRGTAPSHGSLEDDPTSLEASTRGLCSDILALESVNATLLRKLQEAEAEVERLKVVEKIGKTTAALLFDMQEVFRSHDAKIAEGKRNLAESQRSLAESQRSLAESQRKLKEADAQIMLLQTERPDRAGRMHLVQNETNPFPHLVGTVEEIALHRAQKQQAQLHLQPVSSWWRSRRGAICSETMVPSTN